MQWQRPADIRITCRNHWWEDDDPVQRSYHLVCEGGMVMWYVCPRCKKRTDFWFYPFDRNLKLIGAEKQNFTRSKHHRAARAWYKDHIHKHLKQIRKETFNERAPV